jgi:hypothetical protein
MFFIEPDCSSLALEIGSHTEGIVKNLTHVYSIMQPLILCDGTSIIAWVLHSWAISSPRSEATFPVNLLSQPTSKAWTESRKTFLPIIFN